MPFAHTDRDYEQELANLREQLLLMGARVEDQLAICVAALQSGDLTQAHTARERDRAIDHLELTIDELSLRILARRQPVARDLRFVAVCLKIVTDLERMGDLCVGICQRIVELAPHRDLVAGVPDLLPMARNARAMVHQSLDCLVAGDAVAAQAIIHRDAVVDAGHALVVRQLLTTMTREPHAVFAATRLLNIAMALERIADHATNLAEMVVFLVQGTDIRHPGRHDVPHSAGLPRGILFVCATNVACSQLAEALARALLPPHVRVFSAGMLPGSLVHPLVGAVLTEVGIDCAGQRPKRVDEVPLQAVDLVVNLAVSGASTVPPVQEGASHQTWMLADPVAERGIGAQQLAACRVARDAIKERILGLAAG